MTTQNHFFVAIPIPVELKSKIMTWCRKEQLPFQRFVHELDLHITLAFLGGMDTPYLEALKKELEMVAPNYRKFSLTLDTLGYFGQEQLPRIFWASVKKEQQLFELQKAVAEACYSVGIELEKRAYRPHITLARKYNGNTIYKQDSFVESFNENLQGVTWEISSFVIYQTHLKNTPKYESIASFQLS